MSKLRMSTRAALALSAAFALAACGGESKPGMKADGTPATAQEQAATAKCPPQIATPARAADAPVDDIVGVRPGLSFDEAVNVLTCHAKLDVKDSDRGYRVNTYGTKIRQTITAKTLVEAPPENQEDAASSMQREVMGGWVGLGTRRGSADIGPGQEKFNVSLMGLQGQERVFGVAREENFPADKKPTVEAIVGALEGKYGAASNKTPYGNGGMNLVWVYDTFGRKMSPESPVFGQCGRMSSDPDAGVSISPDCGLTISASVNADSQNNLIANSMSVRAIHQSMGMEAISATEKALAAADAAKKAEEVERAKQNVEKPKL